MVDLEVLTNKKKIDFKNFLIKLADKLDRANQTNFANEIDQFLISEQVEPLEFDLEIPEDEKLMLEDVLKSLQDSLK